MNIFHHNNPRPPVVPGEETGFYREVEGCSPQGTGTPPTYLRWATSLPILLADPLGVKLFFDYLRQEGQCHADALDFWFAYKGLHKENDPDKVQQIIYAIYRRYFVKAKLPVSDSLRKSLISRFKRQDGPLSVSIFDQAQQEVEKLINETCYPNFLRSDVYLSYVRSMQNPNDPLSEGSGSHSGGSGDAGLSSAKSTLATLVEDQELDTSIPPPSYPPLTKDAILKTQIARSSEYRPTTEPYVTEFLRGKSGLSKMYSSYNPVSRQDSELQSLSSDARTESDNMSLTDSSIDGMSVSHHSKMSRKQYQLHCRRVKEAACLNRDPYTHQTVIPRTQRIQRQQVHPMDPSQFVAILNKKLEAVKKEREAQEKLDHTLFDNAGMGKSLSEAIWEKLNIDDDDGQHILDQHVSRVFSDQTPGGKSPGSPRPRSPELHRTRLKAQQKGLVNGGNSGFVSYPQTSYQYPNRPPHSKLHSRKEKDAASVFSSDSGNVHDFSESYVDRLHFPKSKSMPDYSCESSDAYSSLPSHGRAREWANKNKYRKPPELTDSGVSVMSDTLSNHSAHNKQRVLYWLMENDKTGASCSDRDSASTSSASTSCRFDYNSSRMSRSNPQSRGRRSPPCELSHLEEARKRLEEEVKLKSRQRSGMSCRSEGMQSGGSTLRSKPDYTNIYYSFGDVNNEPYVSKIPGHDITLKQFKDFIFKKKGNYKYFFKTESAELDFKVIQLEITDDYEILPLWEGKIVAQIKSVD